MSRSCAYCKQTNLYPNISMFCTESCKLEAAGNVQDHLPELDWNNYSEVLFIPSDNMSLDYGEYFKSGRNIYVTIEHIDDYVYGVHWVCDYYIEHLSDKIGEECDIDEDTLVEVDSVSLYYKNDDASITDTLEEVCN